MTSVRRRRNVNRFLLVNTAIHVHDFTFVDLCLHDTILGITQMVGIIRIIFVLRVGMPGTLMCMSRRILSRAMVMMLTINRVTAHALAIIVVINTTTIRIRVIGHVIHARAIVSTSVSIIMICVICSSRVSDGRGIIGTGVIQVTIIVIIVMFILSPRLMILHHIGVTSVMRMARRITINVGLVGVLRIIRDQLASRVRPMLFSLMRILMVHMSDTYDCWRYSCYSDCPYNRQANSRECDDTDCYGRCYGHYYGSSYLSCCFVV